MILVSYINARGEEIILDDTENSFNMGELYGREGTEAPSLKYTEILYGDGSTDIVVINAMPREVTLYFWSRMTNIMLRRSLAELKQQLLQMGTQDGSWGKLKIWNPDENAYRYLNCVYTGGFDSMVRNYPSHVKFALTFRASDPLFYNGYSTTYIIETESDKGFLYLQPDTDPLYFKPLTFSGGTYDFNEDNSEDNPTGLYMKSANMEKTQNILLDCQRIFPKITISGGGRNIRIINETTGKKIELASSVVIDGAHPVIIETKPLNRKVVQLDTITGTETNLLSKLTSDSTLDFYLERGTNIIRYRNSEVTPDSTCAFEYTEGYLSAE